MAEYSFWMRCAKCNIGILKEPWRTIGDYQNDHDVVVCKDHWNYKPWTDKPQRERVCWTCFHHFPSGNKLYAHLKSANHAIEKPQICFCCHLFSPDDDHYLGTCGKILLERYISGVRIRRGHKWDGL